MVIYGVQLQNSIRLVAARVVKSLNTILRMTDFALRPALSYKTDKESSGAMYVARNIELTFNLAEGIQLPARPKNSSMTED